VTLALTVAIWLQGPDEERALSMRKPVSLLELSCQARSMRLEETAVATRLLGALGFEAANKSGAHSEA
jgi:hypothetical protein